MSSVTAADPAPSPPVSQALRISSLADLVRVLRHGDTAQRAAVLGALQRQPQRAMMYQGAQGESVARELIRLTEEAESFAPMVTYAVTLAHMADAEALAYCEQLLEQFDTSELLLPLSFGLARNPSPAARELLRAQLLGGTQRQAVRAAARALKGCAESLEVGERIRLAVLGQLAVGHEERLTEETAASWLRELLGPFRRAARRLLERQGRSAAELLLTRTQDLDDGSLTWLVDWLGAPLFGQPERDAALEEAFQRESSDLLGAACALVAATRNSERWRARIEPLLTHEGADVRKSALRALPATATAWEDIAQSDADPRVRALAVQRLGSAPHSLSPEWLERLIINESHWRPRAAAARLLVGTGASGIALAERLLTHDSPDVRAVMARALLDQGDAEALLRHLPGVSEPCT